MPWAPHPDAVSSNPATDLVSAVLGPVLTSLGFAPGQGGAASGQGRVTFCRGDIGTEDEGCVDLVVDLASALAHDLPEQLA
jgi:hypothetical protein